MAASVTLNVELNDARAKAGLQAIADAIKPLTKTVELNVDTAKALRSIKDLNTIASNLEKTLSKNSGMNEYDSSIRKAESASRSFSNALREQMQAEQDERNARSGLLSEMNVLDQAFHAGEQASKAFSFALRQQMLAEQETADAAGASAGKFSMLGNAISTAVGHLASRAIQLALRKITQGIREALTEMKNVDTELTNISKVSGKTGTELERIGDTAYDTAAKYGVAASEYLSAVYDMQKAGMGDQSEAMGELAVKTMLVGDTTQDVASKFLLSANAAWKFGGNMESLSKVVDEADYINNNYATTLDKLASGMPIVASVAAQAGMSAEETMAALGTITHVTQESGTKAATALRALILNISGQVGKFVTEEGEEFEVTEKSVKSLQGLLEKYAKTEMDAARAAGELINPMTAIQALFKGMAESDLNDVELFNLLSSMGGKLRTNQLTALVQNYELFEEMLGRIADSAGTADKEIGLMMESWERKTQVLKDSWTKLIADVVSTDFIKGSIDWLTDIVNTIDGVIEKVKNPIWGEADSATKAYEDIKSEYDGLKARESELNSIEQLRLEYLEKEIALRKEAADAVNKEAAEVRQLQLLYYTDEFGNRIERDGAELSMLRKAKDDAEEFLKTGDIKEYQEALRGILEDGQSYYDELVKISDAGVELTDHQQKFIDESDGVKEAADANISSVERLNDQYLAFYDSQGNVVAFAQKAADTEGDVADAAGNVAEAADGISFENAVTSAQTLLGVLQACDTTAAGISIGAFGFGFATGTTNAPGGPTLVNELGPELISENGRAYIANGGRPGIVNLSRGAVVLPANVTKDALKNRNAKSRGINAAKGGLANTPQGNTTLQLIQHIRSLPGGDSVPVGSIVADAMRKAMRQVETNVMDDGKGGKKKSKGSGSGGGGGGSSAPTAKSVEELAKETKDILSNIEKQAKLADNRKQYDKEVSLWEKGQKEIDKMVAQYKKAGYKETDDEVLDLLNKRYDYEKKREAASTKAIEEAASELKDKLGNLDKQAKLADTNGDYEKEVRFYEEAQEAIKEMVERYRKAGYSDDSDEIVDLLQKNVDYGEKQVKVYKDRWNDLIDALDADTEAQEAANALAEKEQALADAREALANATKNRTVRTYNAATGQWEWVADQAKVKSAQDTLTKAEENYSKEVKDQAIKELENLRDTMADLNDVTLGPALSAIMTQAESSDVFQNFARALNGVYGVGSFLASTEGSSKVLSTADSHDTFYTFGNVTLTEEQASSMSVAELASRLQVLKIS